jgi:hypothetical protein
MDSVGVPMQYDMNGRFQMQGGKNRILPKEINANRFFWDSHWLEIWVKPLILCPSMGPNGGSVAMDSAVDDVSDASVTAATGFTVAPGFPTLVGFPTFQFNHYCCC